MATAPPAGRSRRSACARIQIAATTLFHRDRIRSYPGGAANRTRQRVETYVLLTLLRMNEHAEEYLRRIHQACGVRVAVSSRATPVRSAYAGTSPTTWCITMRPCMIESKVVATALASASGDRYPLSRHRRANSAMCSSHVGVAGFEPTTSSSQRRTGQSSRPSSGTVSCPLAPWGALVQMRATLLTSWSVSAC
jgi:hypothetical protein